MLHSDSVVGITGGSGYVGSRVAISLAELGYTVIVIDKVEPSVRGVTFPEAVTFRLADLSIATEAEQAFVGVDIVLHLAADIGSLNYMQQFQADIITNNSRIDACVYPAMVAAGVTHVVYSSSSMVYQHTPKYPYTEADIVSINPPTNVYGYSKLSGEIFCKAFYEQYGLAYTIVRYHNIYGPGEDAKGSTPGDIHVIPALLEKVITKKQYPVELLGDPQSTRPFTFVSDAVDATVKLIEMVVRNDTRVQQEDFNIGNDTYYTIKSLAKIIWEKYGDERPFAMEVVPTKAITSLRREVDISKIKEIVGWSPVVSLEVGLKETAAWIQGR